MMTFEEQVKQTEIENAAIDAYRRQLRGELLIQLARLTGKDMPADERLTKTQFANVADIIRKYTK